MSKENLKMRLEPCKGPKINLKVLKKKLKHFQRTNYIKVEVVEVLLLREAPIHKLQLLIDAKCSRAKKLALKPQVFYKVAL